MKYKLFFLQAVLCMLWHDTWSQCTPAPVNECSGAIEILCGLGELNGYTCQNTADQHPELYPCGTTSLCPISGADDGPQNTEWWTFMTNGGNVSITINYSSCLLGQGLQMGIWGDCSCGEEITCHATCAGTSGSFTITAHLDPCSEYYLFVDGCNGDICNYSLTTTGGDAPNALPITAIQGRSVFCKGDCHMDFVAIQDQASCLDYYEWTLDGVHVDGRTKNLTLDLDLEPGDYELCARAYINEAYSKLTCQNNSVFCKRISIEPKSVYKSPDAYICIESVPYFWHGLEVISDGTYTKEFSDVNCCKYDSVRDFYILPIPESPSVYFIGSDSTDLYKDPTTGQQYKGCNNYKIIDVINSTIPYRCDSAYHLFTIYPGFKSVMESACRKDSLLYFPNIKDVTKYCANNVDVKYTFAYRWFETSDTSVTISHEENLNATLLKKGNYCLELSVDVGYGDADKKIKTFFCEYFNEDSMKYSPFSRPIC